MRLSILTIGHSNHPLDRFLGLLTEHHVEVLIDIRRFPSSRKHPHFNREDLSTALGHHGIQYDWMEALGGRRRKECEDSPNAGLENPSFRNYADYMMTHEFRDAIDKLLKIAKEKCTAIMCAEGLYWQCHRRLVSDFLVANGVTVEHVLPNGQLRPHELTRGAVMGAGMVSYPGERALFP
jgi:uncharacterized protein (DUF488 family)